MNTLLARRQTMPPALFGMLFLPTGMTKGFVTVVLGYVLAHSGFSVGVIAGLVGFRLLPDTWSFLAGPLIDSCLSALSWYLLAVSGLALCLLGFALTPIQPSETLALEILCLATGITATLSSSAASAALVLCTDTAARGACAGWRQAGNLGGAGLGGGAGLWLAEHAGGPRVASLATAVACLSCACPFLIVKVCASPRTVGVVASARNALEALWKLVRTRPGVLAVIAVTLPAGLGAASYLMPAVASDWHASADLVATVTGALAGLACIPGCIVSGYLCDRFVRRTVFMWCALIAAVCEAAMALAPHTPWSFAGVVLLNSALTGLAYGAVTAVMYERLEPVGAATVNNVLNSLANVPVVSVTMLIGIVQVRFGSTSMLLAEAGLGVISVALYALLVLVWRPDPEIQSRLKAENPA